MFQGLEHVILTQQSEFHPLSVHTKPHIGDPKAYALPTLCLSSGLLRLPPGHSGLPAKTTNEGKGHFINHPCGVGFVASLSKCNGDSDYSKLVQKTVQHWKKKNGIYVTLKSKANAGRFWVIRLPGLGFLTQFLYDSICSNCQYIFRSSQRSRWGHSERIIFSQLDPGSSSAGASALPALGRFP